jgi:hypothetical protein
MSYMGKPAYCRPKNGFATTWELIKVMCITWRYCLDFSIPWMVEKCLIWNFIEEFTLNEWLRLHEVEERHTLAWFQAFVWQPSMRAVFILTSWNRTPSIKLDRSYIRIAPRYFAATPTQRLDSKLQSPRAILKNNRSLGALTESGKDFMRLSWGSRMGVSVSSTTEACIPQRTRDWFEWGWRKGHLPARSESSLETLDTFVSNPQKLFPPGFRDHCSSICVPQVGSLDVV